MKHVASLRYDVIFKKAFSVPSIFSAFVSDVLGTPVHVDRVETEKRFVNRVGPIDPRFDLYAEDTTRRLIVDIQHERYADHYDRFLYYHCVALLEQAAVSKSYRPTLDVVTIVVLTSSDKKHTTDIATIDFDPRDRHGRKLEVIHHQVIYLNPTYVCDDTPQPVRSWLEAIKDTLDEQVDETAYSSNIQLVFDLIEKSQTTPQELAQMKEEYGREEKLLEEQKTREQAEQAAAEAQRLLAEAQQREAEAQQREAEAQRVATEAQRVVAEAQAYIAELQARLQARSNKEGA